jgi:hypothetical protein
MNRHHPAKYLPLGRFFPVKAAIGYFFTQVFSSQIQPASQPRKNKDLECWPDDCK